MYIRQTKRDNTYSIQYNSDRDITDINSHYQLTLEYIKVTIAKANESSSKKNEKQKGYATTQHCKHYP